MWIRADLKARAKCVLKGIYWEAFAMALLIWIVGGMDSGFGGGGGGSSTHNRSSNGFPNPIGGDFFGKYSFNSPEVIGTLFIVLAIVLIVLFVVFAIRVFLGYPVEVGGKRFFVKAAQYEDRTACISFAFKKNRYKGIVLTMLLRAFYNFLWTLLFIIPGIIKSYAYRMVPYILSDNPTIGYKRAIELSNDMTRGHKFDMFVLDLSFIGWYLLGLLALIVGTLFVMPYELATKAELYLVLKRNAIENGMCAEEELLFIETEQWA